MFFLYESKFTEIISKVFDCIMLSILWIFSSLPIITIGASSTAMIVTIEKVIRQDEGKIWNTYWCTFVREFRQATVLWLIRLFVYLIVALELYILYCLNQEGYNTHKGVVSIALLAIALFTTWSQYWLPYLAKFTDRIPVILKNTLLITLANFWTGGIMLFLLILYLALFIFGALYMPPLVFLLPGIHCYISGFFSRTVLNRFVT